MSGFYHRTIPASIGFAALLRHLTGESSPLEEDIHPNLPLV
jgi:hypothetical protein